MALVESFGFNKRHAGRSAGEQTDIERILRDLISRQAVPGNAANLGHGPLDMNFEGWKRGQLEFAKRLARISAEQARRAEKLRIRHRKIGLARRIALIVMVIAINMPIFL